MDSTHEIIKIERTVTKNSQSPMWRCTTADGQTVNVFQHANPERDTFDIMYTAGYGELMVMTTGEVKHWRNHPIKATLTKDGQWWKLAAVEPRADNAEADADFVPDVELYKERAIRIARMLTNKKWQVSWLDTESTGLNDDDELVAASVITTKGQVLFNELLCPLHPDKLLRPGKNGQTAADVNGITPDKLADAMLVEDGLISLATFLTGRVWVAYNAPFDVGLLERECQRYSHPLIYSLGVHDAMQIVAEYIGQWDPKYRQFKMRKLSDAAFMLGVNPEQSHTAHSDAMTTLAVMQAVADSAAINPFYA